MFPAGDREPQRAGPSSACHFLELRCIHSAGFLSLKPTMTGHCPSTHTPIGLQTTKGRSMAASLQHTQQHTLSDRLFALFRPLAGNGQCDVVHPT